MPGLNYEAKLTLVQRMVDNGQAYRTFKEIIIPANGTFDLSIKNGEYAVGLYSRLLITDQPMIRYEVRTGATITGYTGEPIPIRPLNAMNQTPSKNTFRQCTQSALGELADIDIVPGQAGSGSNASGAVYGDADDLKVLPPNDEFLLHFSNPNNTQSKVLIYLKWFEVPADIWE